MPRSNTGRNIPQNSAPRSILRTQGAEGANRRDRRGMYHPEITNDGYREYRTVEANYGPDDFHQPPPRREDRTVSGLRSRVARRDTAAQYRNDRVADYNRDLAEYTRAMAIDFGRLTSNGSETDSEISSVWSDDDMDAEHGVLDQAEARRLAEGAEQIARYNSGVNDHVNLPRYDQNATVSYSYLVYNAISNFLSRGFGRGGNNTKTRRRKNKQSKQTRRKRQSRRN